MITGADGNGAGLFGGGGPPLSHVGLGSSGSEHTCPLGSMYRTGLFLTYE